MLHKKWRSVGIAPLLAVVVLSTILMRASDAFALLEVQEDSVSNQLFLPIILNQASLNSSSTGEGHIDDDYSLAEAARQRNEPRFVPPEGHTRATGPANQVGQWGPIRTWPFAFASAANLPDGRIAVWGANNLTSFNGGNFTYSSIWDPQTDQLLSRNHNDHSMFCAIPTMLEDGRVIANGGDANTNKVSIFDYRTNQWNRTDNMNTGRWYPGTVALPGDRIFTMLGRPGGPYPEVWQEGQGWDLLTGANLNNGVLNFSGYQSTWLPYLHLMPNGNIFHSGPTSQMNIINPNGNGSISSAGLTNSWYPKYGSAVMYDEGKVLFAGGGTNNESTNQAFTLDFNGPTPTKTNVAPMNNARKFNNGVMLPTGEVMMVGGNTSGTEFSDVGTILEGEIWNPTTQTWRRVANMSVPRNYHSVALLMTDGRVWSAGGGLCGGCNANHPDHQVYSPPYLFNADGSLATRPTINSAPDRVGYGATINVQATAGIQRFTMIKMSGVTHNLNSDQRFLNVDFNTISSGNYSLSLHDNVNVLTPGYWMLFALNNQGVPSVSHVIQIQNISANVSLTSPGNQTTLVDTAVSQPLVVNNPSGGTLIFSASGLPTGLNINSSTGLITGTPTTIGSSEVTINVSDGSNNDSVTFTWAVVEAGSVRYVRLIADSEINGNPWTSMAEFNLLDSNGNPINRSGWTITADSEELTGESGNVENAIDGNTGTIWHTQWQTANPAHPHQIIIDMQTSHQITGFRYLPRQVGTNGTIANYRFFVSTDGQTWGAPVAQGTFASNQSEKTVLIPESANIARNRPATQSSLASGGLAPRAVDGDTNGSYSAGSITHTANQTNAWWQVDLGSSNRIGEIRIWNRIDCCSNRLSNFYVFVSDTDLTGRSFSSILNDNSVERVHTPGQSPNQLVIDQIMTGRYVRVQLAGTNPLSLAEVEVFLAPPVTNIPPTITNPGTQNNQAGSVVSLQINANDPDGDSLTYSATGLPTGLTINSSSGLIAGSLSTAGNYNVTVNADDGNGGSDSISFNWNVFNGLVLNQIMTTPQEMGTQASYTANFAGGSNPRFKWLFGDGTAETGYSTNPAINHTFAQPGRYLITLTATDDSGQEISTQFAQLIHRPLTAQRPAVSMSIVYEERASNDRVWNVNPDNNTVTVSDAITRQKLAEISVGDNPRALAIAPDGQVWVTNKDDATISIINEDSLSVVQTVSLAGGSQPHGIVFAPNGSNAYVALEAIGSLIQLNPSNGSQTGSVNVGANPRHLSVLADSSQVYVSRFITPPVPGEETGNPNFNAGGGEVVVVNSNMSVAQTISLQFSNRPDTEGDGRGIPNYLGPAVISPDGLAAWVPSKQDNIARGTLRDGENLDFDHSVRSVASFINLSNNQEQFVDRVDFDNGGVAVSGQFDRTGAYLFIALEGSREVAVVDAYANTELFRIDVEIAPQGVAVSADGQTLFVHNFLGRSVSVIDITPLLTTNQNTATALSAINSVANERLSAQVLTGKELFYDAADDRLALDNYMSCASCHNAGDSDGRVWDLTGLGEGLRNTISLQGHADQGPLHWSANFDEVHDFEQQIRDLAGGTGLMSNSDFNATQAPLGAPKAGLSADLDALAAYVNSLTTVPNSPYRQTNGSLTAAGEAGKQVFVAQSCATCHSGAEFTDSAPSVMHDIGTLKSASGQRLNGPLTALDTPTLRGLWMTAPYLHDGSAATLADAVNAHNGINLSGSDMTNLVAYLNQIDEREPAPAVPNVNSDPMLTDPGNQTSTEGDTISLQINGTDPDGDTLTFSGSGLPAGLSLNSGSGLIDGSPTTAGTSNVTITVDDGNGGTDSVSFTWTVAEDNTPPPSGTGQITWEYWNTIWSSSLDTLRNDPDFPDNPTNSSFLTSFEAPANRADLFGQRINGYLYPPTTGQYTFWIASDDQGELWISSDDQADNISLIASVPDWTGSRQWNRYPSQQSQTITLQAGQAYYIEALAQEGGGGDNLAVAWQIPGGSREVIAGQYLSPVDGGTNPPPVNNPPVLTTPGNQTNEVGDTVDLQLVATDADNDPLTFSSPGLPAGLNLNPNSGRITGSPLSVTTLNVNVTVNDGNGGTNSVSFLWTVTDNTPPPPNNNDPILTNPSNQSNQTGDNVSIQLAASDADNDTLTFSSTGLPVGLNLNASSGLISGSPTTAGTSNVTISVNDGNGGSDSASFSWTVTTPPPPPPPGGSGLVTWETWNTGWGTSVDVLRNDPDFPDNPDTTNTLISFEAPSNRDDVFGQRIRGYLYPPISGQYIFWIASDDQGELWLSTDDQAGNISQIATAPGWTNPREWTKYPEQQSQSITLQAGQPYYIEALAQEGGGGDNLAVAWQIPGQSRAVIAGQYLSPIDNGNPPPPPVNNPPVMAAVSSQTNTTGDSVSIQLSATDVDNDTLTYSATGLPAGVSLNANSGLISGSPTTAGTSNVTISVNDGNGGSDSASFSWTVNDPAPPPPPPPGGGTGEVRLETWNTSWGTVVSVLRATSSFPSSPDSTQTLSSFEAPQNQGDVFGQRISGYLYPPVTGQYTFWIASDDQGELWLSTTNNPADIALIATQPSWTFPQEWTRFPSQQSVTITLQAGQAYYIEALAQEGGGGDHLAVAWQIPGQSREIIDGQYLAAAD